MVAKYFELKENEIIYILNDSNKSGYSIKCIDNKLNINKVGNIKDKQNIEITTLEYDDVRRFMLFNSYYQEMMSLDVSEDVKKIINNLMDYHFNKVFGERYNNEYSNIKSNMYQCITTFED